MKMKKKKLKGHEVEKGNELEPEPVNCKVEEEDEFYTDDEECDSIESEPDEEHRKFKQFLQDKAKEQDDFIIDFDDILE
jgi:hypothetical protein|tara:strand:+ start:406 stop:642 length:237 start_codon:yes stop_codon:yes gene_type:complete